MVTNINDETCCSKFFPTRWDTFLHLIQHHKGCESKFSNLGFHNKLKVQLSDYLVRDPEEENLLRLKYKNAKSKILDIEDVKTNKDIYKMDEKECVSKEETLENDETHSISNLNPIVLNVRSIENEDSESELEDIENLLSDFEDEEETDSNNINKEDDVDTLSVPLNSSFLVSKDAEGNNLGTSEQKAIYTTPEPPNLCDIKTEAISPTRKFTTIVHDDEFATEFMLEDNDLQGDLKPFYVWANGCVYFCKACKEMSFTDYSAFIKHIKSHQINGFVAYKKEYGEPFSVLNHIQCQICDEEILHDFNKISTHLRKKHKGYSVNTYFDIFVQKQNIQPIDFEATPSYHKIKLEKSTSPDFIPEDEIPKLSDHTLNNDSPPYQLDTKIATQRVSIDSLFSQEGSDCPQAFDSLAEDQCPNREESNHTESKNLLTYKEWVDKCDINCKSESCQYCCKDVIDFKLHTISDHGEIFEDYCDKYGIDITDPWTVTNFINCKLCKVRVKNNYPDIENHMKKFHQISGFTYYMENIKL